VSVDHMDKFMGRNRTRINPLVGLSVYPSEGWDLHISFAAKSRFPSMRSLYDGITGNPDLLSETGKTVEAGFSHRGSRDLFLGMSLFYNSFRNMIDSLRFPDGTRRFFNIDRARMFGLEVEGRKDWEWGGLSLGYTWLDHRNVTEGRPLDAMPAHTLYVQSWLRPARFLGLSFSGTGASQSHWLDISAGEVLRIPGYIVLDAVLSLHWKSAEVFLKAGNLFNKAFYTEPGYPWRGRYLEIGLKTGIL
jgi:outer membrane receptor protein involved in Fe transport